MVTGGGKKQQIYRKLIFLKNYIRKSKSSHFKYITEVLQNNKIKILKIYSNCIDWFYACNPHTFYINQPLMCTNFTIKTLTFFHSEFIFQNNHHTYEKKINLPSPHVYSAVKSTTFCEAPVQTTTLLCRRLLSFTPSFRFWIDSATIRLFLEITQRQFQISRYCTPVPGGGRFSGRWRKKWISPRWSAVRENRNGRKPIWWRLLFLLFGVVIVKRFNW